MPLRAARRVPASTFVALLGSGVAALAVGCGGDAQTTQTAPEQKEAVTAQLQRVADDAEAAQSSPLPAGAERGPAAPSPKRSATAGVRAREAAPATSAEDGISPGAPSDAEIRAELSEMKRAQQEVQDEAPAGGPAGVVKLTPKGNARVPADAPKKVAQIIGSANAIARFPYVYGGGHGDFVDTAYDCSGSVSYALAGAGLMDAPLASGGFASWGEPGPGKWVTIYTNPGHMFMTVGGVRYDTSGRSGVFGSRWNATPRSLEGFTVRHPKGL